MLTRFSGTNRILCLKWNPATRVDRGVEATSWEAHRLRATPRHKMLKVLVEHSRWQDSIFSRYPQIYMDFGWPTGAFEDPGSSLRPRNQFVSGRIQSVSAKVLELWRMPVMRIMFYPRYDSSWSELANNIEWPCKSRWSLHSWKNDLVRIHPQPVRFWCFEPGWCSGHWWDSP